MKHWRADETRVSASEIVFDLPPWFIRIYGGDIRRRFLFGSLGAGDVLTFSAPLGGVMTPIDIECHAVCGRLTARPAARIRHLVFREEFRRSQL